MSALHALPILLALLAPPQAAPSPEEQRLFTEGLRAFEAGDARGAERAWKAGYAVAQDPAFLVRIGEAEEKAGAPAEAAESYRRYLKEAPDASDRADIEQRVARLAPPPAAPAPAEPTHDFGAAPAPVAAVPPPPVAAAAPAGGVPATADAETAAARAEEANSGWNAYRITAWVATAATVALLGTAGFFAASAASNTDDVNLLINYRDQATGAPLQYSAVAQRYRSAYDDGQRNDRLAKGFLIAAAGAAVVAAVFFVLDGVREPDSGPGLALWPAAGGGGTAALGAWTWRY